MVAKDHDDMNREDDGRKDNGREDERDLNRPNDERPGSFDDWLTSCPPADLPRGLREACLRTVSQVARPFVAARAGRPRSFRYRTAAAVGLLATAAVLFVALIGGQGDSVFARALESSQAAEAVYILETRTDPNRSPGQIDNSEWLTRRGHGSRRVVRRNNEIQYVWVNHNGKSTKWSPTTNEVVIQSNAGDIDVAPYFAAAAIELRDYEQKAREQGIPIRIEEADRRGTRVRQIRIEDFYLDDQDDDTLISTLIVDIDVATNRIIRQSTRRRPTADSGDRGHAANSDAPVAVAATQIFDIKYPDPDSIEDSMFSIQFPEDAEVTRDTTAVMP
jgi:hypothetical protein